MTHDLRPFLDDAHERHAQAPRAIAEALLARAPTLPATDDGAEAVRLAEHVLLGHLGDAAELGRFLGALEAAPPAPMAAWTEAVQRARWAHACLSGDAPPAPALPDSARWRAQQNVVLAHVLAGRVGHACAILLRDEAAARSHDDIQARRAYAAAANNVALELREGPRGHADRDALMLAAAALARRAWECAGTWLHVQRAHYQLARCHAVLGQGEPARAHAQACLDACEAHGADADERFFAHEAACHAHVAAGDRARAADARTAMALELEAIADPAMRAECARVLQATDASTGVPRP